ncbi:hypothetical protein ACWDDN_47985 [Streptomyces griseoruber]
MLILSCFCFAALGLMATTADQTNSPAPLSPVTSPSASARTVSLDLKGSDRVTDRSPADLVAVLTNSGDRSVSVSLRANAGRNPARTAISSEALDDAKDADATDVAIAARESALVFIQVRAAEPVRRGKVAVVVTATVTRGVGRTSQGAREEQLGQVTASRELDAERAGSDLLPAALGGGAALLLPGVLAVWACLQVWVYDRRRLGVDIPSASTLLWDNKLWWLCGVLVSLAAIWIYSAAFGQDDLLDTYRWLDLAWVSAGSLLAAFVASSLALLAYRHGRRPRITSTSTPTKVIEAAHQYKNTYEREVYEVADGVHGLLVHRDLDAIVLTPPITFEGPDAVTQANRNKDLAAATQAIKDAKGDDAFDGGWATDVAGKRWIGEPAVISNKPPAGGPVALLWFGGDRE